VPGADRGARPRKPCGSLRWLGRMWPLPAGQS